MNSYSVVIGHLPDEISAAEHFLLSLVEEFSGADQLLLPVMLDEARYGMNYGEYLGWLESLSVYVVAVESGGLASLNLAIAEVNSDYVVIFEEASWPASGLGNHVERHVNQPSSDLLYFNRRDASIDAVADIVAGDYIRSVPRMTENPGRAFVISRRCFMEVRGYDERPGYAKLASNDLYQRIGWLGCTRTDLPGPEGAVYGVPSDRAKTNGLGLRSKTEIDSWNASVAVDQSIFRNLINWSVPPAKRVPLVTVSIATKDRGQIISDSLYSVLYQSFQDFEIVVVDDGSIDDSAAEAVAAIDDSRIRYVKQQSAGISAARNHAADISKCMLTAVHDDDDIMLPDRLEVGIGALTAEVNASFGGWVNFSDDSGEMKGFVGKETFNSEVNAHNGQGPGHSTWTLFTSVIRIVRYDEGISASVDHNLATRLAMAGVKWSHTDKFMYLRRVHEQQVTAQDSGGQKFAHLFFALLKFVTGVAGANGFLSRSWSSG